MIGELSPEEMFPVRGVCRERQGGLHENVSAVESQRFGAIFEFPVLSEWKKKVLDYDRGLILKSEFCGDHVPLFFRSMEVPFVGNRHAEEERVTFARLITVLRGNNLDLDVSSPRRKGTQGFCEEEQEQE